MTSAGIDLHTLSTLLAGLDIDNNVSNEVQLGTLLYFYIPPVVKLKAYVKS